MRVGSDGRVTIPKALRQQLGLDPGTEVRLAVVGDALLIRTVTASPSRGQILAGRLRGRGDVPMSTDEILGLTRPD
jgi:antitoxin PrlF